DDRTSSCLAHHLHIVLRKHSDNEKRNQLQLSADLDLLHQLAAVHVVQLVLDLAAVVEPVAHIDTVQILKASGCATAETAYVLGHYTESCSAHRCINHHLSMYADCFAE